jgi:ribosome maturation factor RimP
MMMIDAIRKELETLIRGLGLEVIAMEWRGTSGRGELHVVIDREGGVTLKDCEIVSRQAGTLLDLKDPIPGRYTLKVLSPGLTRELKTPRDFERSVGKAIRFQHRSTVVQARLMRVADGRLEVEEKGKSLTFPLSEVAHARLLGPWEEE